MSFSFWPASRQRSACGFLRIATAACRVSWTRTRMELMTGWKKLEQKVGHEFSTGTVYESENAAGAGQSRGGGLVSRLCVARDHHPDGGGCVETLGSSANHRR